MHNLSPLSSISRVIFPTCKSDHGTPCLNLCSGFFWLRDKIVPHSTTCHELQQACLSLLPGFALCSRSGAPVGFQQSFPILLPEPGAMDKILCRPLMTAWSVFWRKKTIFWRLFLHINKRPLLCAPSQPGFGVNRADEPSPHKDWDVPLFSSLESLWGSLWAPWNLFSLFI